MKGLVSGYGSKFAPIICDDNHDLSSFNLFNMLWVVNKVFLLIYVFSNYIDKVGLTLGTYYMLIILIV